MRAVVLSFQQQPTEENKMTTEAAQSNTKKEIHNGVACNGNVKYMVVTVCNDTGRWIHWEDFASLDEAKSWAKYA